jgi:hypothetical protein
MGFDTDAQRQIVASGDRGGRSGLLLQCEPEVGRAEGDGVVDVVDGVETRTVGESDRSAT